MKRRNRGTLSFGGTCLVSVVRWEVLLLGKFKFASRQDWKSNLFSIMFACRSAELGGGIQVSFLGSFCIKLLGTYLHDCYNLAACNLADHHSHWIALLVIDPMDYFYRACSILQKWLQACFWSGASCRASFVPLQKLAALCIIEGNLRKEKNVVYIFTCVPAYHRIFVEWCMLLVCLIGEL